MNQTVEALSMRVVQLENALCEQQEIQETLEAEESELKKRLQESEEKCTGKVTLDIIHARQQHGVRGGVMPRCSCA